MPGEPIVLVDDAGGQVSRFVAALAALPKTMPRWAVIGGFAVYVRLARVHRATNDVDTVTDNQDEVVELVMAQPDGERLRTGKVRLAGVDIDVMSAPGVNEKLTGTPSDRAFHLVRTFALGTAVRELIVVDATDRRIEATVPVAGVGSLILLKTVALPRRAGDGRAEKAVSDIQDLVRLVDSRTQDALIGELGAAPEELLAYTGQQLVQRFGVDGRYLLPMLLRAGVQGVEAEDLALVAEFGQALMDGAG